VLRWAPAAAERAAALGAHREAAAHYARALRHADVLPAAAYADLLERHSHECYLTNQADDAIAALERAIELRRGAGDARQEGMDSCSLSQILWCLGRIEESERAAHEAVALLERLPAGRELATAYANVSQVFMNAEDTDGAVLWAERALDLAERLDDRVIRTEAQINTGTARCVGAAPGGREELERSVESARMAGLDAQAGRAVVNLVWSATRRCDHAAADGYLRRGLEFCEDRGLELWRIYLLAYRAGSELAQARWQEALECASLVLRESFASTLPPALALTTIGLVRARRGEPGQWPPLDEALALVERSGELQRVHPVAAARAEAAWLDGDPGRIAPATDAAYALALRRETAWPLGELACWRARAGLLDEPPAAAAEPYALQIRGEWARAAATWRELGSPYEAALALAGADDEGALRQALDELQGMGASPAAAIVARRLRERGVRGLPRGPRPATRRNPAGLTRRELEVLELLAQGLRNADIAQRLFVSHKTVDHHVSAILRKLDVRTRGQASAEAARLGLAARR
jgi:DNA-binding CsgD family transcriptional regulator/tetratricopeptide (TPR) repeat protein